MITGAADLGLKRVACAPNVVAEAARFAYSPGDAALV